MNSTDSIKGSVQHEKNEDNGSIVSSEKIQKHVKSHFDMVPGVDHKLSMRTRHRPKNKSVLQSAIARKEKSFRVDDLPKQRPKRAKPKKIDEKQVESLTDLVVSNKTTPSKKTKRTSPRVAVKKKIYIGSDSSDEATNDDTVDDSRMGAETSASPKVVFDNKLATNSASIIRQSPSPPIIPTDQLESIKNNGSIGMDECNWSGLARAIESCNVQKVAAILELGYVDLHQKLKEHNNGTFLHLAASKGNATIAYLLYSSNLPLDLLDDEQHTALMIAILEHKNDVVNYLIQAGADLIFKGIDGMTSLHIAAKSGNLEACKVLLNSSSGISNFVNFQDDGGWTPLVWACEHGHREVVKYLVLMRADITLRDVEHNVPLHWAAFKGSTEIVELLLNLGSDINVLNVHGDSPLHISAREDHYNCVIVLMSRGSDLSIINRNNETPLDCAPKDGTCCELLKLNVQLQLAASNGQHSIAGLLANDISRGREINPIQCYNSVDSEEEPKGYKYIRSNCVTTDNIYVNNKVATIESCTCIDRCRTTDCLCVRLSSKNQYDDEGKLSPDFNFNDPPMIFECNDFCSCNSILCSNRLVQKPPFQRFQLFKTISKGWSIKSLQFIAAGSFVCEYVGEILTNSEAERREDDSYLFDLDNKEIDCFCIDAKFYGNFSRFINHSCHPNLQPIKVFIDHHDLRFPRIAFFAKMDISPNQELSFDYGDKFWIIKSKSFPCHCGTKYCKFSGKSEESVKNME